MIDLMRFFTEPVMSLKTRFFTSFRMTKSEGFRMTNLHVKVIGTKLLILSMQDLSKIRCSGERLSASSFKSSGFPLSSRYGFRGV